VSDHTISLWFDGQVLYCEYLIMSYLWAYTCTCVAASKISSGLHLTDAQKKLVEEDAGQTLAQQENMQISGSQARQMVMQKLLRANEVSCPTIPNSIDACSAAFNPQTLILLT